jgi:hypothetical protein
MDEGFLFSVDSVGKYATAYFRQIAWMSGTEFKREDPDAWIFKGGIANQQRKLLAWRCTSCAVVEMTAV